ncbi:hypothetical protein Cadr_000002369 [Camelus dromedarius]|uniref:Uncharacterized protein n=1 Tax=Camelus dromedarius TaxID=9838 RepID=A0A5N4EHB3_CAMDR|nr:hypothetical protein Cadr_000002369 [Camelus dromedarius]
MPPAVILAWTTRLPFLPTPPPSHLGPQAGSWWARAGFPAQLPPGRQAGRTAGPEPGPTGCSAFAANGCAFRAAVLTGADDGQQVSPALPWSAVWALMRPGEVLPLPWLDPVSRGHSALLLSSPPHQRPRPNCFPFLSSSKSRPYPASPVRSGIPTQENPCCEHLHPCPQRDPGRFSHAALQWGMGTMSSGWDQLEISAFHRKTRHTDTACMDTGQGQVPREASRFPGREGEAPVKGCVRDPAPWAGTPHRVLGQYSAGSSRALGPLPTSLRAVGQQRPGPGPPPGTRRLVVKLMAPRCDPGKVQVQLSPVPVRKCYVVADSVPRTARFMPAPLNPQREASAS